MASEVDQLHSRAKTLADQFERGGESSCIEEAIELARRALELCPPGHSKRSVALTELSIHLDTRYSRLGGIENINEAIALEREALLLCPPHLDRSVSLNNLGKCLSTRYDCLGALDDLSEAISLGRDALLLCPPGHPLRSSSLNNLGIHLSTRYGRLGALDDLSEAISLGRDALLLCPPGHPDRSMSLNNLGVDLSTRYDRLGALDDLSEAISLGRDALLLCPPGHPDRSMSLNNLGARLSTRYDRLGALDDLSEAISLGRDALLLRPPGHPLRSSSLNNLGIHLSTRYSRLGALDDLSEAISLGRDALLLRPPGHPDRSSSLNNLGIHLSTRYSRLGALDDLSEAISLARDALLLRPPGHPDRSMSLNNLGNRLFTRYSRLGALDDLSEAISLGRDALLLCPPGHPDRSMSLNNLGNHLSTRYSRLGALDDLSEAISLGRDALLLRPPGHPDRSSSLNNLGIHLSTRYSRLGALDDLSEAISLARDALLLCPPGHPGRPHSLHHLAHGLHTRYTKLQQEVDQKELFSFYIQLADVQQTTSSNDLSATRAWIAAAEDFQHSSTLLAYQTALRFLIHHLATLPSSPQHMASLKTLTSSLATDAFSAGIRHHTPTHSIELLEQGRGVFWTQLTRLHSSLNDVLASGSRGKALADEFTQLTSLIRDATNSPSAEQHDKLFSSNVKLQHVITEIRQLPNLSRFLLPPVFSDLQQAASCGPVIIVNASKYSCDALIVLVDRDPIHVPLPAVTKGDVRDLSSKLRTLTVSAKSMNVLKDIGGLLRDLWDKVVSPIVDVLRTIYPLQSRIWWCPTADFTHLPLHAAGPYRKHEQNLTDLYVSSYTPTLTALIRARRRAQTKSEHSAPTYPPPIPVEQNDPPNPEPEKKRERLLPFCLSSVRSGRHNPPNPDPTKKRISSSLKSLFRSKRSDPSDNAKAQTEALVAVGQLNTSQNELASVSNDLDIGLCQSGEKRTRFVAIGQANATGETELLSVGSELANIGQLVNGLAAFTRVEGPQSCIPRVVEELGKNEWVHLACHGIPNKKQPFDSAFALHDGRFTIERIIQCELENPEFAYLSACHTTVGDEESPDEIIHLAAAMQFVGFRSVIGTMWAVDDGQTNMITKTFYKHLIGDSGHLDYTRAALALHRTMQDLDGIVPGDQRILYVHIGA